MRIKIAVIVAALIMCPFLMTAYASLNPNHAEHAITAWDMRHCQRIMDKYMDGTSLGTEVDRFAGDRSVIKLRVYEYTQKNAKSLIAINRAMAEIYAYYFKEYGNNIFTISITIIQNDWQSDKPVIEYKDAQIVYQTWMTPALYNLATSSGVKPAAMMPFAWKIEFIHPFYNSK